MTDPSITPDMPDTAATAQFLRRFADLMSNGQNATYLVHAASLLESLTVRVTAAVDEEGLWRYKYETVTRHADALEAESEALKHDIEGHVNIATSILSERDALKTKLEGKETELSELHSTLHLERGQFATELAAHERALAELLASFEQERDGLEATTRIRSEELDALRLVSEREREEFAAALKTAEQGFADRRLVLEYERAELQAQLRAGDLVVDEANAVVPKATLRQARAQFEYLARQCISRGDIASQVMCELGAHTMDEVLTASANKDRPSAGEVVLSILSAPASTNTVITENARV
jgi:chromosome segregation ATPase